MRPQVRRRTNLAWYRWHCLAGLADARPPMLLFARAGMGMSESGGHACKGGRIDSGSGNGYVTTRYYYVIKVLYGNFS